LQAASQASANGRTADSYHAHRTLRLCWRAVIGVLPCVLYASRKLGNALSKSAEVMITAKGKGVA
jgi:hypothetical protein